MFTLFLVLRVSGVDPGVFTVHVPLEQILMWAAPTTPVSRALQ